MTRSGEVIPVATANVMPTERVAMIAKRPTAIGRDFTYASWLWMISILIV